MTCLYDLHSQYTRSISARVRYCSCPHPVPFFCTRSRVCPRCVLSNVFWSFAVRSTRLRSPSRLEAPGTDPTAMPRKIPIEYDIIRRRMSCCMLCVVFTPPHSFVYSVYIAKPCVHAHSFADSSHDALSLSFVRSFVVCVRVHNQPSKDADKSHNCCVLPDHVFACDRASASQTDMAPPPPPLLLLPACCCNRGALAVHHESCMYERWSIASWDSMPRRVDRL